MTFRNINRNKIETSYLAFPEAERNRSFLQVSFFYFAHSGGVNSLASHRHWLLGFLRKLTSKSSQVIKMYGI